MSTHAKDTKGTKDTKETISSKLSRANSTSKFTGLEYDDLKTAETLKSPRQPKWALRWLSGAPYRSTGIWASCILMTFSPLLTKEQLNQKEIDH